MHHRPSTFTSAAPADPGSVLKHVEIRRAAACRSFWSDDALNRAYRELHGETFTLKDFTTFVEAMPPDRFLSLAFQIAGDDHAG